MYGAAARLQQVVEEGTAGSDPVVVQDCGGSGKLGGGI